MAATELCTSSATLREDSKATESRGKGLEASSPRCNTRQGLEFDGTTRIGRSTAAASYVLVTPGSGLNRINMRLIPTSCNFFSGSPSPKNSKVKRAWP